MDTSMEERLAAYNDPDVAAAAQYELEHEAAVPAAVGEMTIEEAARPEPRRPPRRRRRRRARHRAARRDDRDLGGRGPRAAVPQHARQRRRRRIADLLQQDGVLMGLSDAGAHVSQLCDACMPTDLLGNWVREREVLTLEHAVHKLTGEPAGVYGFEGRGVLAAGNHADIAVFDPDTVAPGPVRRIRDFPADGERLVADAAGRHAPRLGERHADPRRRRVRPRRTRRRSPAPSCAADPPSGDRSRQPTDRGEPTSDTDATSQDGEDRQLGPLG